VCDHTILDQFDVGDCFAELRVIGQGNSVLVASNELTHLEIQPLGPDSSCLLDIQPPYTRKGRFGQGFSRLAVSNDDTLESGGFGVKAWIGLTFWQPSVKVFREELGEQRMTPGDGDAPIALSRLSFLVDDDIVDVVLYRVVRKLPISPGQ
jgi:hypothetical protein